MKGERILYPCYFDADLKRSEGRRVRRDQAVQGPTRADLERAVKRNGLAYQAEDKSHPAHWMKHEGRLVVQWSKSKEELLHRIARKLGKKG